MPYVSTSNLPNARALQEIATQERKAALLDAGRYLQAKAAIYPPKPAGSSYTRTGTLGRSIAVGEVHDDGAVGYVEIGTNLHYAPYVEFGTGIYRETSIGVNAGGDVIRPKNARALAWRSTGRQVGPGGIRIASGMKRRRLRGGFGRDTKRDVYMNFAAFVRGMRPWHYMEKAFVDPDSEAYLKARAEQALRRIAERISEASA